MEEELLKLLGKLDGHTVTPLAARMSATCNRVPVVDGHTVCLSIKLAKPATREEILPPGLTSGRWRVRDCLPLPISLCSGRRSPTVPSRASDRYRGNGMAVHRRPTAPLRIAGLEVHRALSQTPFVRCRSHLLTPNCGSLWKLEPVLNSYTMVPQVSI